MFVSKLGRASRSLTVAAASSSSVAAVRLFASSLPKSVDHAARPSKPEEGVVVNGGSSSSATPATPPPPPPAGPSSSPAPKSSASTAPVVAGVSATTPGLSAPRSSSTLLANRVQPSSASLSLPTVLTQDWLFSTPAPSTHDTAAIDPDAPDASIWALESEIITWFPPSHPSIGRSTPAQAHAAAVRASAVSSPAGPTTTTTTTTFGDEYDPSFAHSLFRQLAISHLGRQALPDAGLSTAGQAAVGRFDSALRRRRAAALGGLRVGEAADDVVDEVYEDDDGGMARGGDRPSGSIALDSVMRKRKKKMNKHKYKKRIKAQKAMRKKLNK